MARVPQPENDNLRAFASRKFSRYSLDHSVYCVPIDSTEQRRLTDLDDVLHQVFQERPVFPDLSASRGGQAGSSRRSPSFSVLDCGCGQGTWIERLLDDIGGDCDVTGVDIYFGRAVDENDDDDNNEDDDEDPDDKGVQEYVKKRWNLNARFREDQSNDRLRPESFDLINSRLLADGINASRWQSYIQELKYMLKYGGWLQMVEIEPFIQSSNGRLDQNSFLTRWWQWYSTAQQHLRKNARVGRELRQHLQSEGFTHIQGGSIDLPIGAWRSGQESLGADNLATAKLMLVSLSLWPFLGLERMPADQYRALINGAVAELQDESKKLYYKVHFVYGQRPRRR